jgi:hypothetical protein
LRSVSKCLEPVTVRAAPWNAIFIMVNVFIEPLSSLPTGRPEGTHS